MNHIYRLIWNAGLGSWSVASELTRSRGKRTRASRRALTVLALSNVLLAANASAELPIGGEITSGAGSIAQSGSTLNVTQNSQNLVIDWQGFDIGKDNVVNFTQPNAASMALNRVVSSDPSEILGQLNANGQVWLINPNGVLFGNNAQVNVGGLVASTLNLSDEDFLSGKYTFSGANGARIVNHGAINAHDGGYIALLGGQVSNQGVIRARLGTVALGAGERITLDFAGDSLLNLTVDEGALGALADNQQLIQADGGQVLMSARAADAVLDTVVNNTGIIEAHTVEREGGVIKLLGGFNGGTVNVAGTLDASAPNGGNGGYIDTSGHTVNIDDNVHITTAASIGATGTWLIDPTDFIIANSGGDITPATLTAQLASSNVVLETIDTGVGPGDIFVNNSLSWSTNTTLTLRAERNIWINAAITNSANGNLVLRADKDAAGTGSVVFGGAGQLTMVGGRADLYYNPGSFAAPTDFSAKISGTYTAWMLVNNLSQLQDMSTNLHGAYALGRDIDASLTAGWNGGLGFVPIGTTSSEFSGNFDGLNHSINNLFINRPGSDQVGLFGATENATIRNVVLVDGSVTGGNSVGMLLGYAWNSTTTITNSHASGTVNGAAAVGGLIGMYYGAVERSSANATVTGTQAIGGLIGTSYGSVDSSYSTGNVFGGRRAGGLIGDMANGTVQRSYATGAVSGTDYLGGLVGLIGGSPIFTQSIVQSYATGAVSGASFVGGLAGYLMDFGSIDQAYATGAVTGTSLVGGLIGVSSGTLTNAFWDVQRSGTYVGVGQRINPGSGLGVGVTTAQMMQQSTFSGWNISGAGGSSAAWRIYEGQTAPLLRNFLTPLTVTVGNTSRVYDGTHWSGGSAVAYSGFRMGEDANDLLGSFNYGGTAQGARNVGTYSIVGTGQYSGQQGYDIEYVASSLTITPRALTIDALGVDRIYDGTTDATVTFTDNRVAGDDLTFTYSAAFDDRNAGDDKNIDVASIGVSGADAGNYTWNTTAATTADIGRATLTVTGATAQDRVYDGTTDATISGATLDGVLGSDAVALTNATIGSFGDKNVAIDKAISTAMGLSGADADNYILVQPVSLSADISRATLTVTGAAAQDRVYDGTADATISGAALAGVVGVDAVALTNATAGSFGDKHVGADKSVSTAMGLSGADADNYILVQPVSLTADITPRALLVSASGQDRVYNGTTAASVSLSDNRIAGDNLTLAYGSAQFSDGEAGSDKSIEVIDITASGADAGNYVWNTSAQTMADITPAGGPNPEPVPAPTLPLTLDGISPEMRGSDRVQFSPAHDQLLINHGIRLPHGVE
ncbi:YDG domain-containing protein [Steroidobacter agaridevorans]|uniref:YDG domain-containing protein n=1 Tax=Steroidobacter agaridevorans TaxID=2695856 RepID=UPI00132C5814|nr:YDG domain-containing protein [Steroidobacter agaridevorans]GFE87641.1 hypothetical protein GCM10011488_25950 [Steroidobacter agaridevorans]